MKSIGEVLREARVEQGFTVEQISRDINISREYLTALEDECFDVFPAETYLLGFLRNYAEYLGLEPEKAAGLYRNYKIGEEPVPLKELVGSPGRFKFPLRRFMIACLVFLLALGGWYGWTHLSFSSVRPRREQKKTYEPRQYELGQERSEWTVHPGDSFLISVGEEAPLFMDLLFEEQQLKVQPSEGGGLLELRQGDEKILPGGDGLPMIRIQLKRLTPEEAVLITELSAVPVSREESPVPVSGDFTPSPGAVPGKEILLLENQPAPEAFVLNVSFKGFCYFRYQADEGEPVEKFYRDGERIRHDVSRKLLVGWSSGGEANVKIAGIPVASGASGDVGLRSVHWLKDEGGQYDLVLVPIQ